jgi:hypothetical protein
MKNLENYYKTIISLQEAKKKEKGTPYISRIENPKELCKTLWIPLFSGNRTACFDLNHKLNGFNENKELWGENGNCGTPYRILEVPNSWDEKDITKLEKIVAKKLNKNSDYPTDRVLKADERISVIIESIHKLSMSK